MKERAVIWLAQKLHEHRRLSKPGHDQVSCWCCCADCNFDVNKIMGWQA